jgi:hypothetical protein
MWQTKRKYAKLLQSLFLVTRPEWDLQILSSFPILGLLTLSQNIHCSEFLTWYRDHTFTHAALDSPASSRFLCPVIIFTMGLRSTQMQHIHGPDQAHAQSFLQLTFFIYTLPCHLLMAMVVILFFSWLQCGHKGRIHTLNLTSLS